MRLLRGLAIARLVLGLLSCASLAGGAPGARSAGGSAAQAFIVYPIEKVRPEGAVRSGNATTVRLAGGEYENVILGVNGPVRLLGLRVSLPSSGTPGADPVRLSAYRIDYVRIERASQWFAYTRGRWPDPLVPLRTRAPDEEPVPAVEASRTAEEGSVPAQEQRAGTEAATETATKEGGTLANARAQAQSSGQRAIEWLLERPLEVPARENRTLLLELFLPAGEPGETEQSTDLSVQLLTEAGPAFLTIHVRPWGFDLPREPAFATAFGFSSGAVIGKHQELGQAGPGAAATGSAGPEATAPGATGFDAAGLVRDYLHLLARYRVSTYAPYEGSVGGLGVDGKLSFDWTGFDSTTGALLDGTLFGDAPPATSFVVPGPPGGLSTELAQEWYRSVEAHLRERGWLDRGFVYVADEPMRSEYPQVRASAAFIKAAAPGIHTLVTEPFTRALEGAVDIWCPDLWMIGDSITFMPVTARWPYRYFLDVQWNPLPRVYRDRKAKGERFWFYSCLSAMALDYPNVFIDTVAQSQRVIPWLAFRHGITGFLYWQSVYAYSQEGDPWLKPYIMLDNGEGNLLYPGIPGRADIFVHEPVPSLRLAILRDGMEDYEYLALLERQGDGGLAARLARMVAPSSLEWPHGASVLKDARERAGVRLAAVRGARP